jgi:hypothetical protein
MNENIFMFFQTFYRYRTMLGVTPSKDTIGSQSTRNDNMDSVIGLATLSAALPPFPFQQCTHDLH